MAVLLSDNRQAYGILSVIFSGFVAVGAGGAGGVAVWLCRGAGISSLCVFVAISPWCAVSTGGVAVWLCRGAGVPIAFFLFVPVALDQAFEFLRHKTLCSEITQPVWRGNEFLVCDAAKLPLGCNGCMKSMGFCWRCLHLRWCSGHLPATPCVARCAVPDAQLQAAAAFGMTRRQIFWRVLLPQMWVYALPGLSNLWMILVKATPLLFLLGVEDVVYWARELGASKTSAHSYPHGDWRLWYFLALLVFYLALTWLSERMQN